MRDRRSLPLRFRRVLVAPLLGAAGLAVAGCGPSELSKEYDRYKAAVEPLVDQEQKRWKSLATLLQERQDDYASPRYYGFLEETAVPYYAGLREQVLAIDPEHARLDAAHDHLIRFADARLEFVHVEVSGRAIFEAAVGEDGFLTIMSGLQEAENLRYEYQEAIGEQVPDAKLSELYSIVDTFRRKYFVPMQQGAKDPEEVQLRLRSHVIGALDELSRRKYFEDDASRLLKSCVKAWLDWHRKLERACPSLQRVWEIKARSEAAVTESEEALAAFKQALEEIRRER